MYVTRADQASGVSRPKNGKRPLNTSNVANVQTSMKSTKKTKMQHNSTGNDEIDIFTPIKTAPANPRKILEGLNSPETPYVTRQMLNTSQSSVKPRRDMSALDLTDLKALKIDAASYNSYLYVGKMTIPGNSVIAVQDHLSDSKSSFRVPVAHEFNATTFKVCVIFFNFHSLFFDSSD